MAMSLFKRVAFGATVPVFCLACDGKRHAIRGLRRAEGVRLVDTPRHATVLVVAGDVIPQMAQAVRRLHDQLPEPRGIVCWNCENGADMFNEAALACVADGRSPGEVIVRMHRDLVEGRRVSSPLFGPMQNPVDWQGKGDHGQGGEGMMGGTPYGRPMPMTGGDLRDGLQLGDSSFSLGPFLTWMPPGLRISLTVQGDVIQQLSCKAPDFSFPRDVHDVFLRATKEPVSLAVLETMRARHYLQAVSDLLYLLEMDGYGSQALQLAETAVAGRSEKILRFARKLRRTGLYLWAARGVGSLPPAAVAGLGPLARAAGRKEDARQSDPAYQGLNFAPVIQKGGDAAAICSQRLTEAAQALDLAGRAGNRRREPGHPLEGPRGVMGEKNSHAWKELIEKQAVGMAWDSFVTWLVSLDVDASVLPHAQDYAKEDYPMADEHSEENGHEHRDHGDDGNGNGESGRTADAGESGETS